jgi:hypothetical protein
MSITPGNPQSSFIDLFDIFWGGYCHNYLSISICIYGGSPAIDLKVV